MAYHFENFPGAPNVWIPLNDCWLLSVLHKYQMHLLQLIRQQIPIAAIDFIIISTELTRYHFAKFTIECNNYEWPDHFSECHQNIYELEWILNKIRWLEKEQEEWMKCEKAVKILCVLTDSAWNTISELPMDESVQRNETKSIYS